jgi:hypothetical protein
VSSLRAYQGSKILNQLFQNSSSLSTNSKEKDQKIPIFIPPTAAKVKVLSPSKDAPLEERVQWIPSKELDTFIRQETLHLKQTSLPQLDLWDPSQDVADDIVYKLEEEYHVPEWSRSHRRGRMEAFVYPQRGNAFKLKEDSSMGKLPLP